MRNIILSALLAAGSSGGTYALMQRGQPDQSALVAQMQRMNVTLEQLQATQLAAFSSQAESANRLLILGRLQVKALTNVDPLPVLENAKALTR